MSKIAERGSVTTVPLILWALIGVIVVAVAAAFYALQLDRARRELVLRLDGQSAIASAPITILRGTDEGWVTRLGRWLRENAPSSWADAGTAATAARAGWLRRRLRAAVLHDDSRRHARSCCRWRRSRSGRRRAFAI